MDRRTMLKAAVAMTAAPVALLSSTAAAMTDTQHPATRVHRLSEELSNALDHFEHGDGHAMVHAASTGKGIWLGRNLDVGLSPMEEVERIGQSLAASMARLDMTGGSLHAEVRPIGAPGEGVKLCWTPEVRSVDEQKNVVRALVRKLQAEMEKLPSNTIDGGKKVHEIELESGGYLRLGSDRDGNPEVMVGMLRPVAEMQPVSSDYDGPGVYEIYIPKSGKRPTYHLDRIPYSTRSGHYYRAESRWKGRLESTHRLREGEFVIRRKLDGLAAELRT